MENNTVFDSLRRRILELGVLEVSKRTAIPRSSIHAFAHHKASMNSDNLEKVMKALFFEIKTPETEINGLTARVKCDPKKADQIMKLAQILKGLYKPSKIILFGSQVNGTWNKNSDIDILLVGFDKKVDPGEYYIEAHRLGIRASFDVILATEQKVAKFKDQLSSVISKALREGVEIHV